MRRDGFLALGRIVAAWMLGAVTVYLALEKLFGIPRLVVIGVAVAIPMFVNDMARIDSLFPRSRRVWLASGLLRGVLALLGIGVMLYLVFAAGFRPLHFSAVIAGFIAGGLGGTLTREIRAAWRAKKEGGRK